MSRHVHGGCRASDTRRASLRHVRTSSCFSRFGCSRCGPLSLDREPSYPTTWSRQLAPKGGIRIGAAGKIAEEFATLPLVVSLRCGVEIVSACCVHCARLRWVGREALPVRGVFEAASAETSSHGARFGKRKLPGNIVRGTGSGLEIPAFHAVPISQTTIAAAPMFSNSQRSMPQTLKTCADLQSLHMRFVK